MRDTLAHAKSELFGLLSGADGTPVAALTALGIKRCFDHEPLSPDAPFSLSLFTKGLDSVYWQLNINLYHTMGADPELAQENLDAAMPVVHNLISSGFGGDTWVVSLDLNRNALVATLELLCGRQDFF